MKLPAFVFIITLHSVSSFAPTTGLTFLKQHNGQNDDWQIDHKSALVTDEAPDFTADVGDRSTQNWLVQWRGEGAEGYSMSLRQWEFTSAFYAEIKSYLLSDLYSSIDGATFNLQKYLDGIQIKFYDALKYQGPIYDPDNVDRCVPLGAEPIPLSQLAAYESAMQYVVIKDTNDSCDSVPGLTSQHALMTSIMKSTTERCSLVRTMLNIVAEGTSYEDASNGALQNGSFDDMMDNGSNANATWSIRLRRYTSESVSETGEPTTSLRKNPQYQARYGKNVRSSLKDEKKAIRDMSELLQHFQGRVNLKQPDCKIYVLEGLRDNQKKTSAAVLLARVVANGPKTSIYAPKTRICVTTTPLCPIASFTMCNIAQILRKKNTTIFDPFAGSCATLLAAAHITNGQCTSIGIEICHNGYVNRDNIRSDFTTRSLPPPLVIRGDCLSAEIRDEARSKIGGDAFDAIVTDPPYGIREAMGSQDANTDATPPLTKLFQVMGRDRAIGKPLLKVGGRLVAFIPVRKGETLSESLPPAKIQMDAGLVIEGEGKEQVLSDVLSRWLVSFVCFE